MSFPRYPAYKPSGMEWLGEVPEHWELTKLGRICIFESGKAHEPFIDEDGEFICVNSRFISTEGHTAKNCRENLSPAFRNDVLAVMSDLPNGRALGKAFFVNANQVYAVNQRVCRLTPLKVFPRFLFWLVNRNPGLLWFDDGVNQTHIPNSGFTKLIIALPKNGDQVFIATFLDNETAKIDALIAEQQRLIELLQEKRQAVISHAVTKGLNPDAPMKDSGVEWLGEVPEHWRVSPLKHLATIQTGIAKGKDLEDMETIDVPYLRVANVQDGYLSLDEVHLLAVPVASIDRYLLNEGDVLMNEGGDFDKLGRGCIWSGEIAPCVHQNHVFAVRPYSVSGEWLNAYTTSKAANSYFISRSKQSTNLASISSTNLMGLPVPLPPAEEARETLGRLNQLINEIDDLKHSAIQAIALLQERRSALISAAVTGQIDVRGLVSEAEAA
jgi:type I restriction enzyme S subunit